jgi:hypothetical protein
MLNDIFSADFSLSNVVTWGNAAVLAAAGLVNVVAPGAVRRVYARWEISPASYVTVGALQLVAAGLLLSPASQMWGIVLAALIAFGAVVLLLDRGRYFFALPVLVFMAGLGAAAVSAPSTHTPIHYAANLLAPAATTAFLS